jgi:hypothetical protein
MKTPNDKEKIVMYERYLHKLSILCMCTDGFGIKEMVTNADIWSYAHRVGNGELDDDQQQSAIDRAFWKLLDTPETDAITAERQRKYTEAQKQKASTA